MVVVAQIGYDTRTWRNMSGVASVCIGSGTGGRWRREGAIVSGRCVGGAFKFGQSRSSFAEALSLIGMRQCVYLQQSLLLLCSPSCTSYRSLAHAIEHERRYWGMACHYVRTNKPATATKPPRDSDGALNKPVRAVLGGPPSILTTLSYVLSWGTL